MQFVAWYNFNISKDNNNQSYVYIESIQEKVIIENINKNSDLSLIEERPRIGRGDQIVTIWGFLKFSNYKYKP